MIRLEWPRAANRRALVLFGTRLTCSRQTRFAVNSDRVSLELRYSYPEPDEDYSRFGNPEINRLFPSARHFGMIRRSDPMYALVAKAEILRSACRLLPALAAILIPASVLSKKSAMLSRPASDLSSPCFFAFASTCVIYRHQSRPRGDAASGDYLRQSELFRVPTVVRR